ncbi:hypothetical protein L3N51_00352 [Metallosphaera sp. J1]|uniref:hypothetical protein n=1 Tax=Metallosphaera TaxID=41980 RepID=UPI001EDF6D9C|nr:hypothetical protein [Metallosphaera javensis (ex Hofmann et al. 2022)]MCG3108071.1 hypothetical protein [Metallosphaera javensis (ex Hofmann et al. 2022)]BCS94077.1 MAG: hypothetical protein MjAS7_2685 [Metallosphaera javensis (ex Sakai et al. 2022)]
MEVENVNLIRKVVNELISRLPEDCAEIANEHFSLMLDEIKEKGIERATKDWYIGETEDVEYSFNL